MKRIFVALTLVLSVAAGAAPLPLRGSYVFKDHVVPLGRFTIDVVDTRATDSTERLGRLRQGGAACEWVTSFTVRCVTREGAAAVPATSLDKTLRANAGFKVDFAAMMGTPQIVSQGTSLTEWTVPQKGRWDGGEFQQYRYLEMSGGLGKIVLPGPEPLWLNTTDGKSLAMFARQVVHVSRWRWHEDLMNVILESAAGPARAAGKR